MHKNVIKEHVTCYIKVTNKTYPTNMLSELCYIYVLAALSSQGHNGMLA